MFLFLGNTADRSKALVYTDGFLGDSASYDFVVSDNALLPIADVPEPPVVTLHPSLSPAAFTRTDVTVMLMIALDPSPEQTSWTLMDADGNTVASAETGTYSDSTMATEMITVQQAGTYTLIVEDSAGDGLCCGGEVFLFLGDSPDREAVLAHDDGQFSWTTSHTFVVDEASALPVSMIPQLPSLSSPPSLSPNSFFAEDGTSKPTKKTRKGYKGSRMLPP